MAFHAEPDFEVQVAEQDGKLFVMYAASLDEAREEILCLMNRFTSDIGYIWPQTKRGGATMRRKHGACDNVSVVREGEALRYIPNGAYS